MAAKKEGAIRLAILLVVFLIILYVLRRGGPCVSDQDCGSSYAGKYCVDGACGPCVSDSNCAGSPAGEYCIGGVCGPCTSASQCSAGEGCVGGTCGPCESGVDCRSGEGCVRGACGPCANTPDCPPGEACMDTGGNLACGPCQTDYDCRGSHFDNFSAQVCVDGQCVACGPEAPCSDGLVCADGGCRYCQPGDCPVGQTCDPTTQRCGSCSQNSDCTAGEACVGGACGPCATAVQCDPGEGCVDGACGPCTADADCASGYTCVDPGSDGAECVQGGGCQTVEDCSPAQDCVEGTCQDPAPCDVDSDCAEGKICFRWPHWWAPSAGECRTPCALATLRSSDCGHGNPPSCTSDSDCRSRHTWCDLDTNTCTCYDWATFSCGQDTPLAPRSIRDLGPKISAACVGAVVGDACSVEVGGSTFHGHCGWWTEATSCESPSDCQVGSVCRDGVCRCGSGGGAPSNLSCFAKHICTPSTESSPTNPVGGCVRTVQTCFGD